MSNQRIIRYPTTPNEMKLLERRLNRDWPHIKPYSVLVAAIGNHWKPGSWQHVIDMVHYANTIGFGTQEQPIPIYAALDEIQDRCFNPYDALGTMRNEAMLQARGQGFEWLLMVDNDVYPDKDTLVRLLKWDMPIVAPYVEESGPCTEAVDTPEGQRPCAQKRTRLDSGIQVCGAGHQAKRLFGPDQKANTGLKQARWCVLSMLLFRTSVFNALDDHFWGDAIGADEGYHFQTLWNVGHRPYLDTNIQLRVGQPPTYPLATLHLPKEMRDRFWGDRAQMKIIEPDRKPIDPNTPHQQGGDYLPFMLDESRKEGHTCWICEANKSSQGGQHKVVPETELRSTIEPVGSKPSTVVSGLIDGSNSQPVPAASAGVTVVD